MTAPPHRALPYGRQQIDEDDIEAVAAVLRSDYLTTGPAVARFEEILAGLTGAAHAVACSSGTAALHLALAALGAGEGDVAVVPAITFAATANAARFVGAEVVFADVHPDTGLMTPGTFEAAVADARERFPQARIRACLPVHLNGQCADTGAIAARARASDMAVVEDACHAIGGRDAEGAPVGACSHSDMACFSGHPVKSFAMGEGGAVTTNDIGLSNRLARLRSHGIVREPDDWRDRSAGFDADGQANPWYHEFQELGFNYRASDLHCALGASQLGKLDRFVAERRKLADRYHAALSRLAPLVEPLGRAAGEPAWHLQVALVDFAAAGVSRAAVMRTLGAAGIGSQVHYIPVHRQPYYRDRYGDMTLPGADAYYARALSLPLFVGMSDDDVDYVVDHLASALGTA